VDAISQALPALLDAWTLILQPAVLAYLLLGVVMGLGIGVFPGLGGIAGLSLILPFMFGMDPVMGLALMIGMLAVVPTSDTFASVLMGIPGSSASQATVLDGFPLARNGEAARALAAAFTSSLFGGLVGALFLTVFILVARPIVLAFGLPEMLMVTVLGLSMVAVLAGRVPLKGLAAAGLGMMIGTIGEADAGGSLRMASYDIPYLTDGLKLVIVGLGIFAIPEIVSLLRQDKSISRSAGSMAIFIGAVALLGSGEIEVGPNMLKDNLDVTYGIVWLLALANVFGTVICIMAAGGIAKLTTIRFTLLAPFLFMLIAFAAFQSGQNFEDLLALFIIGLIGIFLRRFDWSRPAFLIGFVLSDPVENFSNQAFQIASFRFRKDFDAGMDYVFSPIVLTLIVVTVVSVVVGIRQSKRIMAEGDVASGNAIPDYAFTDKVVPLVIGTVALLACLVLSVQMIVRPEGDAVFADKEVAGEDADAPGGLWGALAWLAGLIIATGLVGYILCNQSPTCPGH